MMFFEGGIPSAVAIVSPLNEGSRTTNAPCTPLSENKHILKTVLKDYVSVRLWIIGI